MKHIYTVRAVYCTPLDEEKLKVAFERYKEKFPEHKYKDCQTYKNIFYPFGDYELDDFMSSVHETLEIAQEYVLNNVCDINEAGTFDYAVISRVIVNCAYYNTQQNPKEDFWIYKFNHNTRKYELLDESANEYGPILSYIWGHMLYKEVKDLY